MGMCGKLNELVYLLLYLRREYHLVQLYCHKTMSGIYQLIKNFYFIKLFALFPTLSKHGSLHFGYSVLNSQKDCPMHVNF